MLNRIIICAGAVLTMLGAGAVQAAPEEDTFEVYQIVSGIQEHPKGESGILRSASVDLPPDLSALRDKQDTGLLQFPTFSGDVEGRIEWARENNPDSFTLSGSLAGADTGYFILTVHNSAVAVSLHGTKYGWLRVAGSPGGYELQEVDEEAQPECGTCKMPQPFELSQKSGPVKPLWHAKEESAQIDVLVVYTPAALVRAGTVAALEAQILNSANQANLSYANSNIPLTISVVKMAPVEYVEDYQLALALAKLTFDNDGVMDEVHDLRDEWNADMVSLIASGGDVAGIGWILASLDATMAQRSFSITVYNALGSLTFAHELGHNMGCDHDQQNITADGYRLFSYSRGWRFYAAEDGVLYRTVMSYAPGARIPHFSNPDISYKGTPTGVAIGHPDEAHCAQTITYSTPYIAQNRPVVEEGEEEGEPPIVYEGYFCEKLGGIYTNALLRSLLPPFAIALFDLLNPETADLNGGADPENMIFLGNGMLDCAYELGLLREVLDTTTLDLSSTGGVTHSLVKQAYVANQTQLVADIGTGNVAIVNGIAPGLLQIVAAYITLGDDGSVGFIEGLLDVINEVQYVGALNLSLYTRLSHYLAAEGDADGDGATNREEYEAYNVYGPEAYISYALNPTVFPSGGGSGEVLILGRPEAIEGTPATLRVLVSYMIGTTTIQWYKDKESLDGETGTEYHMSAVTPDDAGTYKVLVVDESKGLYESPPFVLEVLPPVMLPLSDMAAAAALALVLSCFFLKRGWAQKK